MAVVKQRSLFVDVSSLLISMQHLFHVNVLLHHVPIGPDIVFQECFFIFVAFVSSFADHLEWHLFIFSLRSYS